MIRLKARFSSISNVIVLSDGFIILENYEPKIKACPYFYKLDLRGNVLWEHSHPQPESGQYVNLELRNEEIVLHEGSGEGHVNPITGELSNWVMTR